MNVRDWAKLYIRMGWYPVPLRPRSKACRDDNWQKVDKVYVPEDFDPDVAKNNIGLKTIKASDKRQKKLVAIDLDCEEAVRAVELLPQTAAYWTRPSKPISQVLYYSTFEHSEAWKDLAWTKDKKNTLVEIRVNHQSMAPPSIHPDTGEELTWAQAPEEIKPAEVAHDDLLLAARMTATAALLGRHWPPPGARHDWTLALAGALRSIGLKDESGAAAVVRVAATIAGDAKVEHRLKEVTTTYAKAGGDPVTGARRLAELTGGEEGDKIVESLRKIWGVKATAGRGGAKNPNDQDAIRAALEEMGVKLWRDDFASRVLVKIGDAPEEHLDDAISDRLWLQIERQHGFRPSRDYFDTVVRDTANQNRIHPVRQYLDGLAWDQRERIGRWLIDYGQAADTELTRIIGKIVLVAAVRRVRQPGAKFDELLILESEQGWNKSTALRTLCPREEWFAEDLPLGVDAKEVIERTAGKWILEASELRNMRGARVEQMKAFLSRQKDGPVRMAYGRNPVEALRHFIIIGSTNDHEYLRDSTGNRRFWPVRVGRFDLEGIRRDRDQLWAEAAAVEKTGFSIRLPEHLYTAAAHQQERRLEADPWEDALFEATREVTPKQLEIGKQTVDPEVLWNAIGKKLADRTDKDASRISAVMQKLGFRRVSVRAQGKVVKGWSRRLESQGLLPTGDVKHELTPSEKLKAIRGEKMGTRASEIVEDDDEDRM